MKRITSKILLAVLALALLIDLSGCAALKKKFTRKRKKDVKMPVYYQVRKYDITPSLELYEKHYIFWVNWHKELVQELGDNFKSDKKSAQEMIANLEDMGTLLVDEKRDELTPHIVELQKVKAIIDKRNMTKANETRIRHILDREYRAIKREFSTSKMKNYIRKEWR